MSEKTVDELVNEVREAAVYVGRTLAQSSLMHWLDQWTDTHDMLATPSVVFITDLLVFVETDMIATDAEHPEVAAEIDRRTTERKSDGVRQALAEEAEAAKQHSPVNWFLRGVYMHCSCGYNPKDNGLMYEHWAGHGIAWYDDHGQLKWRSTRGR